MVDRVDGAFPYLIDAPRRFVLLECTDPCTPDRLAASIRRVLAEPQYQGTFTWIGDERQQRDALSPEAIQVRLAVIDSLLAPCSARRWVRVVDRRRPSIYASARRADAFMETIGWQSFSCGTLEEAFAWCQEETPGAMRVAAAFRPLNTPTSAPALLTVLDWPRPLTRPATAPVSSVVKPPTHVPIQDRRRRRWQTRASS